MGDLSLQSHPKDFVDLAQNLTLGKSQGGVQSLAHYSHPSMLVTALHCALTFESECSCSAPLTLLSLHELCEC